ncbi:hypothetical protein ACQ4WQ_06170 [Janthinobacterium sp. GB1R12]|uniref:hypothetical protein n=1 Tax=Janthinobacterium sp. GB1R12 TaxID=3424190 RepID=UPI003F238445
MASKFYAGMKNVVEVLNQMSDAFAAGPYNALPLTGGALTGPVTTNSTITAVRLGQLGIIEQLALLTNTSVPGIAGTAILFGYPGGDGYGTRIVGAGDPAKRYAGYTAFETGEGLGKWREVARFTERGSMLVGTTTDNDVDLLQLAGSGGFAPAGTQGTALLRAGLSGAVETMVLRAGNGALLPVAPSVMYVGKNSTTNSSITTLGTVNTPGNDYAEYIVKSAMCDTVAKGQIIGITSSNTVTDQWGDAVLFAIKSTAPSFVGGDTWASCVGPRPIAKAGQAPKQPPRLVDVIVQQPLPGTNPPEYQDVVTPGDTDAEWAAKQAAYAVALAAHDAATQQDAEAMAAFDAALEAERQKVDRIAIAGRVPVNVLGAQPGDYIVPVQDGAGIKGIAVREDDLTMKQYLHAVGRVISIEPDGRAYVMVKAV